MITLNLFHIIAMAVLYMFTININTTVGIVAATAG